MSTARTVGARLKSLLTSVAVFGVSSAVALLLLEVAVRAMFPESLVITRNDTSYFRPGLGLMKTPGQVAVNHQACYQVSDIHFNSLGFRDNEVPAETPVEVGILGPSQLEAVQVPDGEDTAAVMEKILGQPVLNMSVGGGNSVKALRIYQQLMAAYRPKVVLLFITLGNNIKDNGCLTKATEYEALGLPEFTGTCGNVVDGRVVYREPWEPPVDPAAATAGEATPSKGTRLLGLLRDECRSCRKINDSLKGFLGVSLSPTTQSEDDGYRAGLNVYRPLTALTPAERGQWEDAWRVTEASLVALRDEVAVHEGRLVVVSIGGHMLVSREWRREFKTSYGYDPKPDLDPMYPVRLFDDMARRHQIPVVAMESVFTEYRDRFDVRFPYFSYACDGHWNPLGHFLAASWLSEKLVQLGYLGRPAAGEFARARQAERNRLPAVILGEVAYRSLYRGGIFRNHSSINTYRPQ